MASTCPFCTSHVHCLEKNHNHANDLSARIKRVTQCFKGGYLPAPTNEVNAAWKDLPNHNLPLSSTASGFFPASPPTPTRLAFVDGVSLVSETTMYNRSHDASSTLHVIETPTSNPVELQAPRDLATGYGSSSEQTEDTEASNDSTSVTTNHSVPSSCEEASAPINFNAVVNTWISQYRSYGTGFLVDSLIASGVESLQSASLTARAAQIVVQRITRVSPREGKDIQNTMRFSALEKFKEHWASDGTWVQVSSSVTDTVSLTLRSISIAGLMGGLFSAGISNAKDIQLCLSILLDGDKHFDRLCAMHALLVRSNDKLCKNRHLAAMMGFKDQVTAKDESGELVWVTSPHSREILEDILATIERWMALQTVKRAQYQRRTSAPERSVGPRLRNIA